MKEFEGKKLLITGGTGSFGEAVVRRFIGSKIAEIRILSRDEKKQEDLRISIDNPKLKFYIGDVRDINSIEPAIEGVDYLFHAAALKQVPSCEFFPMEAYKTNVVGTNNILNLAEKHQITRGVILSTDKAVYPINAMGISKAMMEKVVISKSRLSSHSKPSFCITRYGNVMASRGSVIPLFVKLIKEKKPLTITNPSMTRFLMSLDESMDLVLYAFKKGISGDIFVQKSPATTIEILAEALIKIFDSSSKLKIIGPRHGEKLYESLLSREEMGKAEMLKNYFRIPIDARDLNYNKYVLDGSESLNLDNEYNSHNTKQLDLDEVVELLLDLPFIRENINA